MAAESPAPDTEWVAAPAGAVEWPATLALLYAHLPPDERRQQIAEMLARTARDELSLEGLLVARRGQEIGGAMLLLAQTDRTAFYWPPVTLGNDPAAAKALYATAREWLDNRPILWAQCLVGVQDAQLRAELTRNGFPCLTELLMLIRTWEEPLPDLPAEFSLSEISYSDAQAAQFAACLEETYRDSRDCPQVSRLRTGAEALAGYRRIGQFDPAGWKLFSTGDGPAGLVLMSFHPEQKFWELVYLGIVPQARGQGLGRCLLLRGLHWAHDRGGEGVFLCVDSTNQYAVDIYKSCGFVEGGLQAVHWRPAAGVATTR